jgi:hypothetical protein
LSDWSVLIPDGPEYHREYFRKLDSRKMSCVRQMRERPEDIIEHCETGEFTHLTKAISLLFPSLSHYASAHRQSMTVPLNYNNFSIMLFFPHPSGTGSSGRFGTESG